MLSINDALIKLDRLIAFVKCLNKNQQQINDINDGIDVSRENVDSRDYTLFRKMFNDCSFRLEADVPKLILGWSGFTTDAQIDSLLSTLFAQIELLVTYAHLVCGNSRLCCKAAQEDCGVALVNLLSSLLNLMRLLAESPNDARLQLEGPQHAGSIMEACKKVRLVSKSNRMATKRVLMRFVVVIKDVHLEFSRMAEKQQAVADEQTGNDDFETNKRQAYHENEPVQGTDDWYMMMDDLADDDDMEDDELARIEWVLPFIATTSEILRVVAVSVDKIDEWFQIKSENGENTVDLVEQQAYMNWLNDLTHSGDEVNTAVSTLGMKLYPPHDPLAVKNAFICTKNSINCFIVNFKRVSARINPESVAQVTELLQFLAEYDEFSEPEY